MSSQDKSREFGPQKFSRATIDKARNERQKAVLLRVLHSSRLDTLNATLEHMELLTAATKRMRDVFERRLKRAS